MSLSSILLSKDGGRKKSVDVELDAIFRSSTSNPPASISTTTANATAKRKRESGVKNATPTLSVDGIISLEHKRVRITNRREDKPGKDKKVENTEKSNGPGTEDSSRTEGSSRDTEDTSSEGELIHETLLRSRKAKKGRSRVKSQKYVPEGETSEQRDRRTIFIGNLSVHVAEKRPLLKQFHRHILASTPLAKIESTRFRSVPFQVPTSTSTLRAEAHQESPTQRSKVESDPNSAASKQPRAHDRERAASWRGREEINSPGNDRDGGKIEEKIFLNPKQKKKIAFINQEFHSDADTVNAYIVFAHPPPTGYRPPNLPPPPQIMDPYEAARLAVEKSDGTVFMNRRIRVDHVNKVSLDGAKLTVEGHGAPTGDPKLSIFVGNLDFTSKEEDLRELFEQVITAERGPPAEPKDEPVDGGKPKTWVTRVRIIRDKDTQLGKGFAYVQFADRECVDEMLAIQQGEIKFAKRKLRVQRCKSMPNKSAVERSRPNPPQRTSDPLPVTTVPKGDPSLGEKLAHLQKDARKKYKSSDADRVARRLAKKKAGMALKRGGVAGRGTTRDRVRKSLATKKGRSRGLINK